MSDPILILGASTRAAAVSAIAAGLTPTCVDYFADVDLERRCQVMRAQRYPQDLLTWARSAPPGPWMYTGALENRPRLVNAIATSRPLWGNPGSVLRKARQPASLAKALAEGPCRYPATQPTAAGLPRDSSWLRKPLLSCRGRHIDAWDAACRAADEVAGWHFQQRVAGQSCSATYVAAGGRAALLGATEQLVGAAWTGASGYRYAGSLGPISLSEAQHAALVDLGHRLAGTCGLVGLFGVDLVVAGDDVWVIEVNPRFPASVEVLERACGFSAVGWHMVACREGRLPKAIDLKATPPRSCGKAILFARREVVISADLAAQLVGVNESGGWSHVADIPAAGTVVRTGWPILTLRTEHQDPRSLLPSLRRAANHWYRMFEQ